MEDETDQVKLQEFLKTSRGRSEWNEYTKFMKYKIGGIYKISLDKLEYLCFMKPKLFEFLDKNKFISKYLVHFDKNYPINSLYIRFDPCFKVVTDIITGEKYLSLVSISFKEVTTKIEVFGINDEVLYDDEFFKTAFLNKLLYLDLKSLKEEPLSGNELINAKEDIEKNRNQMINTVKMMCELSQKNLLYKVELDRLSALKENEKKDETKISNNA